MNNLSYAVGEVCDLGCNYTFPERIAEFARTHPDSEAFVFRQMEGKTLLHYCICTHPHTHTHENTKMLN